MKLLTPVLFRATWHCFFGAASLFVMTAPMADQVRAQDRPLTEFEIQQKRIDAVKNRINAGRIKYVKAVEKRMGPKPEGFFVLVLTSKGATGSSVKEGYTGSQINETVYIEEGREKAAGRVVDFMMKYRSRSARGSRLSGKWRLAGRFDDRKSAEELETKLVERLKTK